MDLQTNFFPLFSSSSNLYINCIKLECLLALFCTVQYPYIIHRKENLSTLKYHRINRYVASYVIYTCVKTEDYNYGPIAINRGKRAIVRTLPFGKG